jgi:hypothetical protein
MVLCVIFFTEIGKLKRNFSFRVGGLKAGLAQNPWHNSIRGCRQFPL